MNIEINNLQKKTVINPEALERLVRWLMHKIERRTSGPAWNGVSLELLDDQAMIPLNMRFFDRAKTTDVISLAYAPIPGIQGRQGELFVNVERALDEGQRRRGAARELALYIAHGCDHLGGAVDNTLEQVRAMRRRELAWMRQYDKQHPIADIMEEST